MKNIAFIFKSAPHGDSSGREGLDALLSTSTLIKNIGVFFIGDGIFQILSGQKPNNILLRDYISTFRVLPLYDITRFFICSHSLKERGIMKSSNIFVLNPKTINQEELRIELEKYHVILTF